MCISRHYIFTSRGYFDPNYLACDLKMGHLFLIGYQVILFQIYVGQLKDPLDIMPTILSYPTVDWPLDIYLYSLWVTLNKSIILVKLREYRKIRISKPSSWFFFLPEPKCGIYLSCILLFLQHISNKPFLKQISVPFCS